jgi:hypothetical protein
VNLTGAVILKVCFLLNKKNQTKLTYFSLSTVDIQTTSHLPTLFKGDALVSTALFPTGKLPTSVKFTAEDPDGTPISCEVELQQMKESNQPFIALLAARQVIA